MIDMIILQIETVHRTYSDAPISWVLDKGDLPSIERVLTKELKDHQEWVKYICDSLPFNYGEDTFLISPSPNQILNSSYRGKIVKISPIK